MDLNLMELIQSLHREMKMLDRAIASLEEFQRISRSRPHSSEKRRGRKSMSVKVPTRFHSDQEILVNKAGKKSKKAPRQPRRLSTDTSAPPLGRTQTTGDG
jgi:hypothetical protein